MRTVIVMLLLAVLMAGCSGVIMNATYSNMLDQTVALSAETAKRADANQLNTQQMKDALRYQAQTWAYFQKARDGKAGDAK
jgi:PBP1b-binding outer membrane lipoprotein LpoB